MVLTSRFRRNSLVFLVLAGLFLRVLFLRYGVAFYYNGQPTIHLNGDSPSYIWSFKNLFQSGRYTFDYLVPDAYFGRFPSYPFFYGLHYLIFGPRLVLTATSVTQAFLDSYGIVVMFGILRRVLPTAGWAPLVGAALYAFYPFVIVWLPIIGTESLSNTLTLLWLYCLLGLQPKVAYSIGLGILLAITFYVREYLGVLVPIITVYLVIMRYRATSLGQQWGARLRISWRNIVLVCAGFGLLYARWPLRNYALHGRVMLAKPKTAGYATFDPELDEYRSWLQCWTNDENPWIEKVLRAPAVEFPPTVFADFKEQEMA